MKLLRTAAGRRYGSPRRRGVILTTAMILILPGVVAASLGMLQVMLIEAAKQRVAAATRAAAEVAARGGDMTATHEAAGLVLGYLGGDYRTEREYLDVHDATIPGPGSDGAITAGDDVAVGVTLPMGLVSTNYMGLVGINPGNLRIRCVLIKEVTDTPADTSCP